MLITAISKLNTHVIVYDKTHNFRVKSGGIQTTVTNVFLKNYGQ
jgi:hypothetical protein